MVITVHCPSCDASFPVDPAKIPEGGVSTRCSACRTVFRVERPEPEVEAPPPPPVEASDSGPSTSLRVPGRTDPLADAIAPYLVKDRREPEPEPEPQFVREPEPEPEPGFQFVREPEPEPEFHAAPALVDEPEAEAPAAWFDDEEDTSDPLADAFISTGLDEEDSPVGVESPSVEPEPEPEPVEDDWVLEKRPEVADVAGDFEVEPLETIESTVEDARNEPIEHAEGFETHTFVPDDPESSSVYMGEAAAAESDDEEVSYGLDDALVSDGLEDALILPPDEADDEADVSADEPEVSRNQEASPVTQSGGGSLADLMAAADTDHATEAPPAPPARPVQAFTFGQRTPEEKAQRLARVLVSDMIMYNPERHQRAVANGTLREDFDDEIEKSWKEYVEQVGEEMASRTDFWTEALNEVLARGEQIF